MKYKCAEDAIKTLGSHFDRRFAWLTLSSINHLLTIFTVVFYYSRPQASMLFFAKFKDKRYTFD